MPTSCRHTTTAPLCGLHFFEVFNNMYRTMDINEIKKLIKNSTAVLVLDNGEPSFVVMDYKSYKGIASEQRGEKEIKINHGGNGMINLHGGHEQESEILERLNKEILALKAQIEMEEKATER